MSKVKNNRYVGRKIKKLLQRCSLGVVAAVMSAILSSGVLVFPSLQPVIAATNQKAYPTNVTNSALLDVTKLVETGKKYYQLGQFQQAIAVWQQAYQQLGSQGDTINQAAVLSNLALAYQQLGDLQQANTAISQSVKILESQVNSRNLYAAALNIQGSLQREQGQTEAALLSWEKATAIYQKLGDKAGKTRCLLNQSQALRALGLYRRAKSTLEQVYQSLQNEPDSQLKIATLFNLGDTLRLMGDRKAAEAILQQSLQLAQKLNSKEDITLALLSLGNNARNWENTEESQKYYQQVIATSDSDTTKLQAQLNLLRLLVDTQQQIEAEKLIPEISSKIENLPATRTNIYIQINFAQSIKKMGSREWRELVGGSIPLASYPYSLFSRAFQQAESIGDKRGQSYALGYLGGMYEQTRQWEDAQKLTQKALMLALTNNASDIAYRWQWQLGRLLKAQGKIEEAITAYNEAVKTLGYIRNDLVASNIDVQFSFRESVEPIYRELVALLLQPQPISKKNEKSDIQQEKLKKAREVIESLQLAELDNYFREACLTARPQQIDQIDPTAAVVYPIILPDRLEVVISIPNQPLRHYTTKISQTELEKILDKMRRSLRRTASEKERLKTAQQVYDILIRPAETDLQAANIKTLAFVLDGAMKNLPMATLYDGEKYLIEKYSLALTPSLQLLAPRPLATKRLKILVGGLSESRQGFVPLPGVETEVQEIKAEISSQVLFNQNFTTQAMENQFNRTRYPIVHLATHGQFSSNAEDTFVLTWDNRINVKQLGELLQNRQEDNGNPIELLVLSACQTADGDKRAALGLAGVAVRSGARSTVASLWSVDDNSTSAFMSEFYRQLAQSKVTKAEALRNAQISLLKQPQFKHPFYWAPFVLVGNWL